MPQRPRKGEKEMYNRYIERLLRSEPEKAVTKGGTFWRRMIFPIAKLIIPIASTTKLHIIRQAKLPSGPVIIAPTHGFREDIFHVMLMANRQSYILIGALPQVLHTNDGLMAWLSGTVLVDRTDKQSRAYAREKLIRALNLGASIVMYPEGTWNKSPNKLVGGLFPGVYDVAKESGVKVAPLAILRYGSDVYAILDEPFDISLYDRHRGVGVLRDKLATMMYEMMERHGVQPRDKMAHDPDVLDRQWQDYIEFLEKEVPCYDYEVEKFTPFIEKGVTEPQEVYAHLDALPPHHGNAFLFRRYLRRHLPHLPHR